MSRPRERSIRTKIVLFAAALSGFLYFAIFLFVHAMLSPDYANLVPAAPFIIAGFLITVSGTSFLAYFLAGYATSPVRKLAHAVRKFAERDFSVRAEVPDTDDETAEIAKDFNIMAGEIEQFSRNLENLVASRTKELSKAYEALQLRTEEMSKDLKMAQRVQMKIIPSAHDMPERTELSFGAYYGAMTNVGGDIYDAIRIGKNSYGFLMADVSGHGVPAALIASMVKMAFHSKASWGIDPKDVCGSVNDDLIKVMSETDLFVTVFYAILDLESGTLRYSNCGHHPGLLIRKDGRVETLDTEGTFLGFFEAAEFRSATVQMDEGDRLFLFTDGIPEAFNHFKEQYGDARIRDFISGSREKKPGEFIADLIKDLEAFAMDARQSDDRSALLIEFRQRAPMGHS